MANRVPSDPKKPRPTLVSTYDQGVSDGRDAERTELLIFLRREALANEGQELGEAYSKLADRIGDFEHVEASAGKDSKPE